MDTVQAERSTPVTPFGSSPVPTKSALRRQMLPTSVITIDGKRQLSSFQNLKTQRAFKLAELVETHRMAIVPGGDQDEITEEFSQIKLKDMDKDGKLKIVGKDEVKEAIGRSPDTGDTFIMRMYFELLKDATGGRTSNRWRLSIAGTLHGKS
jgi:hypothetical protein